MTLAERLIAEARRYLGEKENPRGSNRSTRIDYWNLEAGAVLESAWCLAFLQQVGRQTFGYRWPLPRTAYVQAIVDWARSRGCLREDRQVGDLLVLWYPALNRFAHVALITEAATSGVRTIEGNTNTDGSRDGYGVFERRRLPPSTARTIRCLDALLPT